MRIAVLFCLALILSGCATVADIRAKEPIQILESIKAPEALADCVLFKAPSEVGSMLTIPHYDFSKIEYPKGQYQILVRAGANVPVGEAAFKSNGQGGSIIELRSRWNFWDKIAFWACIKHCASPQNSPEK